MNYIILHTSPTLALLGKKLRLWTGSGTEKAGEQKPDQSATDITCEFPLPIRWGLFVLGGFGLAFSNDRVSCRLPLPTEANSEKKEYKKVEK